MGEGGCAESVENRIERILFLSMWFDVVKFNNYLVYYSVLGEGDAFFWE